MLSDDDESIRAIRELVHIQSRAKPVVIWLGAGVSANVGLPDWQQLAESLHAEYKALDSNYVANDAVSLLRERRYPDFFSICKKADPQRFRENLVNRLVARTRNKIFARFVEQLQHIKPLRVVTTNVDESLEAAIQFDHVVQHSDIERLSTLLPAKESFLIKAHGSISSAASLVFASEDYTKLTDDARFTSSIQYLLSFASMVFIGYSLRDEYLLQLLAKDQDIHELFGAGPHFVVTNSEVSGLPSSVKRIRYYADSKVGHRGFVTVLDLLKTLDESPPSAVQPRAKDRVSKFYLPDFYALGTWQSSTTFRFNDLQGKEAGEGHVGTGFTNEELGTVRPLAMHNLVVGLVCYEKIVLPIQSLGAFHHVIGAQMFWNLIDSGCVEFVWAAQQPAVIFSSENLIANGGLGAVQIQNLDRQNEAESFESIVFRQISIIRPDLISTEALVGRLRTITTEISGDIIVRSLQESRGALVMPQVRRALGMSDGVVPSKVPKWFVFPVLRVAHLLKDSAIAEELGAAATQLPFGTRGIADATFGVELTDWSATNVASYVVAGNHQSDLGEIVRTRPELFTQLLKFRDSAAAQNIRDEILKATKEGGALELSSSIDGALKSALSPRILDSARQEFASLFFAENRPSLLTSSANDERDFQLWRNRSAAILREIVIRNKVDTYGGCLCGSGDAFKFCCKSLLN